MRPRRAGWDGFTRSAGYALVILLLLASPAPATEPRFPTLTGRVVDEAGILGPATQSELTTMLAAHEQATGNQVVVATLKSLQGYSIEDFGYQLGRHWGVGQKDKNNGVLLVVAPNERKVRIEVGYGLEDRLTDAISRTIIEQDILPAFRRGDFNAGVLAGATSILTILSGDGVRTTQSGIEWDSQQSVGFRDPMLWVAIILMGGWGALFLALYVIGLRYHPPKKAYLLNRTRSSARGALSGLPRSFYQGGYGGDGYGAGGSGGGGGFSGGGGSFGGGGASGGW
jgi:uncharacterized protein